MGSFTIQVADIVSMLVFIVQMGCLLGALAFSHGRLDQRIKTVESHADTVQRIGPMEAEFAEFKRSIEQRLESVERAIRESAAATQALALAIARKAA